METIKLEAGRARERRSQTNPTQLRDLISIEYKEITRNEPNVVIHNHINMLRGFLALFSKNMNAGRFTFHSRFGEFQRRQPSQNKPK